MVDTIKQEPEHLDTTTHSVRELIGCKVKDLTHTDLGHVEDLIIDGTTGRVTYAILAFGGLLGVGEKRFPVPWETLHWHVGDRAFVLQHHGKEREELRHAPHVTPERTDERADRSHHLREMVDRQLAPAVHSFYPGGPNRPRP
jgi:sporulation protein YlmC with PRC-barrel domain